MEEVLTLELLDEFDERFEDELELELLDLFDERFDDVFDDVLELVLVDVFELVLAATIRAPWPVGDISSEESR